MRDEEVKVRSTFYSYLLWSIKISKNLLATFTQREKKGRCNSATFNYSRVKHLRAGCTFFALTSNNPPPHTHTVKGWLEKRKSDSKMRTLIALLFWAKSSGVITVVSIFSHFSVFVSPYAHLLIMWARRSTPTGAYFTPLFTNTFRFNYLKPNLLLLSIFRLKTTLKLLNHCSKMMTKPGQTIQWYCKQLVVC